MQRVIPHEASSPLEEGRDFAGSPGCPAAVALAGGRPTPTRGLPGAGGRGALRGLPCGHGHPWTRLAGSGVSGPTGTRAQRLSPRVCATLSSIEDPIQRPTPSGYAKEQRRAGVE